MTAPNPSIVQAQASRTPGRAHVLVIGNEKGGSGKSTTAMHVAVALMADGARVATLDLDARQGTLTRYLENRVAWMRKTRAELPMPKHASVPASQTGHRDLDHADEKLRFEQALEPVLSSADFVIVDTPGSDTHLSQLAHTFADTLVTPLNDSFIDLDLLARVDADTLKIVRPSVYAEAVWRQRQLRAAQGGRPRREVGLQPRQEGRQLR
ncbi:MAG TPA: division plane positioning ATPase MipZ [Reyranellaceae bacterium]|nr:division plane positioning ATPase MipZ [Reyranellaceae bacterium]